MKITKKDLEKFIKEAVYKQLNEQEEYVDYNTLDDVIIDAITDALINTNILNKTFKEWGYSKDEVQTFWHEEPNEIKILGNKAELSLSTKEGLKKYIISVKEKK